MSEDVLGSDPALKAACERLPTTGADLASQPTISRFENMPSAKDQLRKLSERMAEKVISRLDLGTRRVVIDVGMRTAYKLGTGGLSEAIRPPPGIETARKTKSNPVPGHIPEFMNKAG